MKIVLATSPNKKTAATLAALGVTDVLVSWWYLKDMSEGARREVLEIYRDAGVWVMIDSGAHTFFGEYAWLDPRGGVHAKSGEAIEQWLREREARGESANPKDALKEMAEYVRTYIEFIKIVKKENLAAAWAELDIDPLIGMEPIREWRGWWREADLLDGLIVTIHPTSASVAGTMARPFQGGGQSLDDADEMMSGEYGYVGINAGEEPTVYDFVFARFLPKLRETRAKTHGWGMTTVKAMARQPWFSVDSSSWLSFGRWGLLYKWDPFKKKMESVKHGGPDPKLRDRVRREWLTQHLEEWTSTGLDPEPLLELDSHTLEMWNALQWSYLQKHYREHITNAYWLTPEQKAEKVAEKRSEGAIAVTNDRGAFYEAVIPGAVESEAGVMVIPDGARPSPFLDPKQMSVGRFCDSCVGQDKCPAYEKSATCSLTEVVPFTSPADMVDAMKMLLSAQLERVQFALLQERMAGGFLDPNVSSELERYFTLVDRVNQMGDRRDTVTIKAKGAGAISTIFGKLLQGVNGGDGG